MIMTKLLNSAASTPSLADLMRMGAEPVCRDTLPIFESPPMQCCKPICGQCPPKVRLRDYIRIKPSMVETCFLVGEDACDVDVKVAHKHCITGHIRKRGECTPVLKMHPIRATTDGKVCFKWDERFWRLGDNDYELDIMYDTHCSTTVGLRVSGCHLAMLEYTHTIAPDCKVPPACAPQIEDEACVTINECEDSTC